MARQAARTMPSSAAIVPPVSLVPGYRAQEGARVGQPPGSGGGYWLSEKNRYTAV
jgi:hypothetical protein